MARYSTEDILSKIEQANGGHYRVNLADKDLSNIDLSSSSLGDIRTRRFGEKPTWYSDRTGGVDLRGAFLFKANLTGALLDCADLRGADLRQSRLNKADLTGADLSNANLKEANLKEADLRRADLTNTNLVGVNLEGANLTEANLAGVNLLAAKSLRGIHWYHATLDRTRMTKAQLGNTIGEEEEHEFEKAREAYLALKNNFRSIGRYGDASWAYYKERKMERLTHKPSLARKYFAHDLQNLSQSAGRKYWQLAAFHLHHTLLYLRDLAFEKTCDYGENIGRFLLITALTILLFTEAFWLTQGIGSANHISKNIVDYVIFSLASFSTVDLGGLDAVTTCAKVLKVVEGITGITAFALLMFMLGNRISRA